jgi:uncharacterized protein (TIGR02996 family)
MEHDPFLTQLAANPHDQTTWLVYADWLADRDDPTGEFIRTSIDIFHNPTANETRDAQCAEWRRLMAVASLDPLPLLWRYAVALPVRFRVGMDGVDVVHGSDGRKDTTTLTGRLEVGTLRRGAMLGVPTGDRVLTRQVRAVETSTSGRVQEVESGLCIPDEYARAKTVTIWVSRVNANLFGRVLSPESSG